MSVDDLVKKDSSFAISSFISTANSMYVMLQSAVMIGNLSRVKSKISDKVSQKYQRIIDEFENNDLRQMYEDINIKKTEVLSITNKNEDYFIQVLITSLAKDYVVDKKNLEYRYGVNNQKITKSNYLTFKKDYRDFNNPWILDDIYTN